MRKHRDRRAFLFLSLFVEWNLAHALLVAFVSMFIIIPLFHVLFYELNLFGLMKTVEELFVLAFF